MIEFRARKEVFQDGVTLYAKEERDGKLFIITCEGIKYEEAKNGQLWPQFLLIDGINNYGQSLFQALWDVGYRPNQGEGSDAHTEALKYHLEDMRKLVFK